MGAVLLREAARPGGRARRAGADLAPRGLLEEAGEEGDDAALEQRGLGAIAVRISQPREPGVAALVADVPRRLGHVGRAVAEAEVPERPLLDAAGLILRS